MFPEVCAYNQEIVKFVQEVNVKYGISLNYTGLEVSEVPHWTKMFKVLVKTNIQQEVQPTQVSAPNFSVPPPQVNVDSSHQQAEINRLTQVMQQWSAKGPCQYNQPPLSYSQDRFNTSTGRCGSVRPHSTPNMSLVPTRECPDVLINLSNRGMAIMTEGFNIIITKSQTEGGICMLLKFHQTMLVMILPL